MAAHADDLLYLFNVNLPILLCDQHELFPALALAYTKCILTSPDLDAAEHCVTDHGSDFKLEWGECFDGQLTDAEMGVSDLMTRMFSNFVVYG